MSTNKQNDDEYHRSFFQTYGLYSAVGFQIVAAVVLGAFLGKYIDDKLATPPLFLIIGVILGTAAGFYSLFRTLELQQRNKRRPQSHGPQSKK